MNPLSNLPRLDLSTDRIEYRTSDDPFSEDIQQWLKYFDDSFRIYPSISVHKCYTLNVTLSTIGYSIISLRTPTGKFIFKVDLNPHLSSVQIDATLYKQFLKEFVQHADE